MSEVIEEYIRRNSGMREDEAFEAFLQQDRIRAWVGTDDGRKERLRREFTRVWQTLHPPMTAARPAAEKMRGPAPEVQVEVRRAPAPAAPVQPQHAEAPRHAGPGKKLQVLCPTCGKHDVFNQGGIIACRTCSHRYEDMLELIPVQSVGPFTFLFGHGWKGFATAVGIVVALGLVYLVLRA